MVSDKSLRIMGLNLQYSPMFHEKALRLCTFALNLSRTKYGPDFGKKFFLPPTADFYFGTIAHDYHAAFSPMVFLYVLQVNQECAVHPKKSSTLKNFLIIQQGPGNC